YDHVAELEESGYITKARFGRSYILKLTPKFFEYFDLSGKKDIEERFKRFKDVSGEVARFEHEKGITGQKLGPLDVYQAQAPDDKKNKPQAIVIPAPEKTEEVSHPYGEKLKNTEDIVPLEIYQGKKEGDKQLPGGIDAVLGEFQTYKENTPAHEAGIIIEQEEIPPAKKMQDVLTEDYFSKRRKGKPAQASVPSEASAGGSRSQRESSRLFSSDTSSPLDDEGEGTGGASARTHAPPSQPGNLKEHTDKLQEQLKDAEEIGNKLGELVDTLETETPEGNERAERIKELLETEDDLPKKEDSDET
ncbi:hypothetical protein COY95_02115, partial [Candidatus Woesearchaeota archaeon CG_4_10_14_0_8_um_filter_47_5]